VSSLAPLLRASLVFPSPGEALLPQTFIDSASPELQALAALITEGSVSKRELAIRAFEHIRDSVPYEFMAKFRPDQYRAMHVLDAGRGFCVQKAVLLAALLRACGIPSALVLGNLKDHTMPRRIVKALGTNVMHGHGFTAVWLDGEWLLVDASHDARFATRKGYELVSWDGACDALIAATALDGRRHAQFVALQGVFLDLPFEALLKLFAEAYAEFDLEALAAAGLPVADMLSGDLGSDWLLSLDRKQA